MNLSPNHHNWELLHFSNSAQLNGSFPITLKSTPGFKLHLLNNLTSFTVRVVRVNGGFPPHDRLTILFALIEMFGSTFVLVFLCLAQRYLAEFR